MIKRNFGFPEPPQPEVWRPSLLSIAIALAAWLACIGAVTIVYRLVLS